jgi:urease accessory protein
MATLHPAFEAYAEESVPAADVGAPGKDGELRMTFAKRGDESELVRDYARVPFHLSGTLSNGDDLGAATAYIQSPTAGIAQGDRHEIAITAEPGANALVSTGSATKVLEMERNYGRARVDIDVSEGAHVEYVPDQIILHRNARYHGETDVTLGPDASAILTETVVPGRLARGEAFEFGRYLARTRAEDGEGLLLDDTTHLCPDEEDPRRVGVMGEHAVYGTLYALAPDDDTEGLADAVHERVADGPGRASASALPRSGGVTVRALGARAAVSDALYAAWDECRRELTGAGAPDLRKP